MRMSDQHLLPGPPAPGAKQHVLPVTSNTHSGRSHASSSEKQKSFSAPRTRRLCRSLGLDSIYLFIQKARAASLVEDEKIVELRDFRSACYASLLHFLPIAAITTLLILNLKGFYIGSELAGPHGLDSLKFLGLQLAAKMLELLVVASLSVIMFALIRYQSLHRGTPFGALSSGFEFSKVSFLWSKEFAATCSTRFHSRRSKLMLVTSTVIFTLLAATIGPSAAVAALPILQNWPAGGTSFHVNAKHEQLYPSLLDVIMPSEISCASTQNDTCFPSNHDLLAQELFSYWPSVNSQTPYSNLGQLMPENTLIVGRQALHRLAIRFRGPFVFSPDITAATTPSSIISDLLSQTAKLWAVANNNFCARETSPNFCYYNDIFYSIEALQPVAYVRCNQNPVNGTLQFPVLDRGLGFPLVDLENSTLGSREWFASATGNGTTTGLTWISLPEATFGQSTIGAVVALPSVTGTNLPDQVLTCTVDARWANSTATISFLGGPLIVSGAPDAWFLDGRLKQQQDGNFTWQQVKMTPDWAQRLNTVVDASGRTAFNTLSSSSSNFKGLSQTDSPLNVVEAILAVMIVEGMARIGNTALTLGSLVNPVQKQWARELFPKGTFGSGGSAFNFTPNATDQFVRLEMKTRVNGYGYGITTASALSSAVLIIYSLIAVSYVVYTIIFSRTTSDSWHSITELIALAVNSEPTAALHNTGAGISCMSTLRQRVAVGVAGDQLQLLFSGEVEEHRGSIASVAPNTYYR